MQYLRVTAICCCFFLSWLVTHGCLRMQYPRVTAICCCFCPLWLSFVFRIAMWSINYQEFGCMVTWELNSFVINMTLFLYFKDEGELFLLCKNCYIFSPIFQASYYRWVSYCRQPTNVSIEISHKLEPEQNAWHTRTLVLGAQVMQCVVKLLTRDCICITFSE